MLPVNVFDFTVSGHRDGPDDFLVAGKFVGKLMANCYSGYQGIALRSDSRMARGACNAHARRKLFESRENYPLRLSQLPAMFQKLYDVEDRARAMTIAEREQVRVREARPVRRRMCELLDSELASRVLPKEKSGEAPGYLRNQWDALQLYLSDGRLPIDNNEVEQLMKQLAIGRKDWLFIGSVPAGERAADLLALFSSALRNDLDACVYVKDVLDRLLAGSTDYASLRRDRWARSHPDHIVRTGPKNAAIAPTLNVSVALNAASPERSESEVNPIPQSRTPHRPPTPTPGAHGRTLAKTTVESTTGEICVPMCRVPRNVPNCTGTNRQKIGSIERAAACLAAECRSYVLRKTRPNSTTTRANLGLFHPHMMRASWGGGGLHLSAGSK
jgi:hypothetical protein